MSNKDWHAQDDESVLQALSASTQGLTQADAVRRLAEHGPNRLPEQAGRSPLWRFLAHFHSILIYVLLVAAVITALLGHAIDTSVILAVVLANAVIGYLQEGKAEKAMTAIRNMLALRAAVMRDGKRQTLDGEQLVPGDVVLLEAGDKVPADLRLLKVHNLQIQEAILTGESVAAEKQVAPVRSDAALGDRTCMAYSGTLVSTGQAKGVVVATAGTTEIGQISGMLAKVEVLTTPMVGQMNIFARWLTVVILCIAAILLAFGYVVEGIGFGEIFMVVVGITVAAIPAGLPAVLTITLAVGVQSMARRNAIVRRLPAIETLGSVSVICSDKTGTLTRNEMVVTVARTAERLYSLEGAGYAPLGAIRSADSIVEPGSDTVLTELARAAALCNDAHLNERDGIWAAHGDPMEGALLALAGKIVPDLSAALSAWNRSDVIPFDAANRFMAVLIHANDGQGWIYVKGAPEQLISMCRQQRTLADQAAPQQAEWWLEEAEKLAGQGQRVLALAVKPAPPGMQHLAIEDLEQELIMLGLLGLVDPPRPEAISAVAECHAAGIRVKMITGDHKGTAAAIGQQIGLDKPGNVLTGVEIDQMDDAALARAVLDSDVFARTSPEHKLRLVMALQSHGVTVAMTGDGVNDAPALKRADAGIAMGMKGSEAAKEASELVLADDNFASIVAAVREGRTVYDNIKKVISWTLPTNAGEALTIIAALLLGMTLPITPVQILWINMVTAVTLGIALAFEPTEANTMHRPPRPRAEALLTSDLIWSVVLTSILFMIGVFGMYSYAIDRGYSLELARTLALNTLVVMEIFYLFFIRNIHGTSLTWKAVRGTRVVWLTVALVTAAQFAITYVPLMQRIFATAAVPLADGLRVVAVGVILFVIVELEKQVRLRLLQRRA